MSNYGNPEKAKRYLSLLDNARCDGHWSEVPELARKVGKHAPWRKCLVLTAQAETEIALSTTQRPSTASSFPNRSSRPALRTAIANEKTYPEDVYQAQVCLASGFLSTGEKESAVSVLPSELLPPLKDNTTEQKKDLQSWTYICSIKGAFLADLCNGSSSMRETNVGEVLRNLALVPAHVVRTGEYHFWTEKLLMRLCGTQHRTPKSQSIGSTNVEDLLAPFRAWARFWGSRPGQGLGPSTAPELDDKKRQIWWEYYKILSQLLKEGYVYPGLDKSQTEATTEPQINPRMAQSAEIRRVEATYEGLLLRDLSFPEASEIHTEVDEWVDQLMANWSITCGSSWQDDDLGQGGQDSAGRNVLDMLYRAATRSFQSNSILRHLFTVHASLGEFELSAKALDSYLEIVTNGKERAEKSGKPEPGIDSDESLLRTVASGIGMLCRFGRRKQAERSQELSTYLGDWLAKYVLESTNTRNDTTQANPISPVPSDVTALSHKAIAISKANWSRFTLESSQRTDLQNAAIHHLRQAMMCDPDYEEDPATLYALAVVLAEIRDIDSAIATVKHALSTQSRVAVLSAREDGDLDDRLTRVSAKIGMVKSWHLLALLLSAREDFEKAEVSCEAACDVFDEHEILPGELDLKQLSVLDKQHIIEAKITKMALAEINEGSEVAVQAGGELLQLYSKIFEIGNKMSLPATKSQDPPKTSAGHKSLRESIFGRSKETRTSIRDSTAADSVFTKRISNDTTRPPTIAISDGEYLPPSTSHSNRASRKPSHKLQKRPSQKSMRKSRNNSPARTVSVKKAASVEANGMPETPKRHRRGSSASQPYEVGLAVSDDLPQNESSLAALPNTRHDPSSEAIPPVPQRGAIEVRRPVYDIILPKFSPQVQERYSLSLLSQIWIFISGLYRRAHMHEDARGAIQEAFELAQKVEAIAAAEESSAKSFQEPGKGGSKSVNELWADAYAAQAQLLLDHNEPHDAVKRLELALSYFPDHPVATVALSAILLDMYTKKIPLEPEEPSIASRYVQELPKAVDESSRPPLKAIRPPTEQRPPAERSTEAFPTFEDEEEEPLEQPLEEPREESRTSPEALDRLSARDRAYGLLFALTKLGNCWDDSEAWCTLARAYEESGQPDKAIDVYWWVVELEGKKPVRNWRCLGQGYSV